MVVDMKQYGKLIQRAELYFIIAFFAYTMVNKALDMDAFMMNIAKTGVFKGVIVDIVAYGAIMAELMSILLLIFSEVKGVLFALLLMTAFTIYIIMLYTLGRYEVCGCGGVLNGLAFHWHLIINVVIIVVLVNLLYYEGVSQKA